MKEQGGEKKKIIQDSEPKATDNPLLEGFQAGLVVSLFIIPLLILISQLKTLVFR